MRLAALSFAVSPVPALAWEHHRLLVRPALEGLPPAVRAEIEKKFTGPCTLSDPLMWENLKAGLELNPRSILPPKISTACAEERTPQALLESTTTDEPDMGMDQELPDSFDPEGMRQWMGGKTGIPSQGFRHMFFGGWTVAHPLTTFQIPTHAIGLAPVRAKAMAEKARELLRSGKTAWGWRVLGWSMHYIQDLSQPFHSVQLVSWRFLPLGKLLHGFGALVKEATRTVGNYHWALEQYVATSLEEKDSPFRDCLEHPESHMNVRQVGKSHDPLKTAYAISEASIEVAPEIGQTEMEVMGRELMEPRYDLPRAKGTLDYREILHRKGPPEFERARERLHAAVCTALANGAWGTRELRPLDH